MISVYMCIVSKALLISSATVIVRAGGAIWLNPFATVLFNVCSAVTVECCMFYTRVAWVCLQLCKEVRRLFSSVQLLRGGIWACVMCHCLCWVWDGDYVSQLPYVWYSVGVKHRFQRAREECECKGVCVLGA